MFFSGSRSGKLAECKNSWGILENNNTHPCRHLIVRNVFILFLPLCVVWCLEIPDMYHWGKKNPCRNVDIYAMQCHQQYYWNQVRLMQALMKSNSCSLTHYPVKDGWMVSGQETIFLLGFSSLVNHGGG
jgi:hypothetical protein